MNVQSYLIETILSLDPIKDIYKSMNLAKILFTLTKENEKTYKDQSLLLIDLENKVYQNLPLKTCYELYFAYGYYSLNYLIKYRTKKGKELKIPLHELKDAMRRLYFSIVETIFKSGITSEGFEVGESGDLSYKIKEKIEETT